MKILLAADGSDYTNKMVEYVLKQRELFDPSHAYTVFNAQMPLPNHAASVVGSQATHDYHDEEARKVLEPVVSRLQAAGLSATSAWKTGSVGETIADYATQGGYDLVLMGSHGHGALGRLVMGSVANRVLAHCTVPVLLVR
ncbi:universal stress protein [Ramlibacter rhizophilus]|uniref:Universal stress protein n=1 Tax=Ramlibacter rhizophilus TaxID=1781167 RepID=A0A4Z0BIR0_9BURK|nr:universal stress protein [Ramlibacter rhizophilus]TFY98024.1 universal stress protein [Ramlibacter rhizophilus]